MHLGYTGFSTATLLRADRPLLARLAGAARAGAEDLPAVAAEAVRISVEELPEGLATAQLDVILGMVDRALRVALEKKMMEHPRFRSETFRRWYAQATGEGRAAGLAEGKAEGKAEGLAEGKAEGLAEGKAEGKAQDILTVLAARGIPVSPAFRARILRCADLDTLDTWLRRAAVASSASAVLRAPSSARGGEPARKTTKKNHHHPRRS